MTNTKPPIDAGSAQAQFNRVLAANTRRNTALLYADGIFFGLGNAAFVAFTVLPGFLRHFTANPLAINAVVAMFLAGLYGLQVISCWQFDSHRCKSPVLLRWSFIFRLAVSGLFLVALFSREGVVLYAALFLALYGIVVTAWGLHAVVWTDLVGRWVDEGSRSRVLGVRTFLSQVAVIASGIAVMAVLSTTAFPRNYTIIFLAGAVMWWGSHIMMMNLREAPFPMANPRMKLIPFIAELLQMVRKDNTFRFLILSFALASAHAMSTGLYVSASMDRFFPGATAAVRDGWVGKCSLILNISMACGALGAGWLLRKRTNWSVLQAGYLFFCCAALNAFLAPVPTVFLATFALNGLFLGIEIVAGMDLMLKLAPVQQRMRCIAMVNTARGAASAAFPFIGGAVSETLGNHVTFLCSAAFAMAAMVTIRMGRNSAASAR